MQKICKQVVCFLVLGLLLMPSLQPKAQAQDAVVSYQTFYDDLSPYGQWVYDPNYGNVWVPNVEPGFRPYATEGHWAMTEYGNMWVSDAPWGWAAYHYGRWTYNSYYGWVWIPGHEWAPAWVSWRSGGGYYGWAPMGPGYIPGRPYEYPDNYWVFVGPEYLYHPHVYSYYEPRYNTTYIQRTTYINETYEDHGSHTTYYYGPRREVIERESHHPVEVYKVSNASEPGNSHVSNNTVQIYRPAVNRESANTAHPANVIQGSGHPVGRAENFSPTERQQPAFRQEVQQQHMQQQRSEPPVRQQPQQHIEEQRPQPQQHMEEQRPQQQHMEPQQRPQPQQHMEQEQRPQPQQHMEEQQRPQPQQRPQQQRPQPQQRQQRPQRQAPPVHEERRK